MSCFLKKNCHSIQLTCHLNRSQMPNTQQTFGGYCGPKKKKPKPGRPHPHTGRFSRNEQRAQILKHQKISTETWLRFSKPEIGIYSAGSCRKSLERTRQATSLRLVWIRSRSKLVSPVSPMVSGRATSPFTVSLTVPGRATSPVPVSATAPGRATSPREQPPAVSSRSTDSLDWSSTGDRRPVTC